MGLFTSIGQAIKKTVQTIGTFIRDVVEWVSDKFGGFGTMESYPNRQDEGKIDLTKRYAEEQRELINGLIPRAEEIEKRKTDAIFNAITEFQNQLNKTYPEIGSAIEQKKEVVRQKLSGIISESVRERSFVNDEEFRKMAVMPKGDPKKKAAQELGESIIRDAQKAFDDKLRQEMIAFQTDIENRFRAITEQKDRELAEQRKKLDEILRDEENRRTNIQKVKSEAQFYAEYYDCVQTAIKIQ